MKRYQWKVLPQGMMNSPMLCQLYVASALEEARSLYPQAYIIHYMNDILLVAPEESLLNPLFHQVQHDPDGDYT